MAGTSKVAVVARGAAAAATRPGLEPPAQGRRRRPHSGPETVSSVRLHHGWAGEGEDMERLGGREVSKMILE